MIKLLKIISMSCLITNVFAERWTLVDANGSHFPNSKISVYIASDTCSNAGLTPATIQSYVKDAYEKFWNNVPTSALEIKDGGLVSTSVNGNDLTAAANKAPENSILIGCNDDLSAFSATGGLGVLGVGGIACATSSSCRGAIILNDKSGTYLSTSTHDAIVTVIAHEMGHALGLGHSSIQPSLMYYNISGKTQNYLTQDDIDGITYLYPNEKKIGGLAGSCASIKDINDDDGPQNGQSSSLFSLLLGLSVIMLFFRFRFTR